MRNILILFVVAVIASGCVSSTPNNASPAPDTSSPTESNQTSAPTGQDPDFVMVRYTDSGFSPETITVEQGDTVRWVDESSRDMWVGSDRHPTHTNYAGSTLNSHCQNGDQTEAAFDQCSTGSQFSFTFEKTGEWSYHNHVAPGDSGTVVVN